MKIALAIGATGLVGSNLVNQLLDDERFGKVVTFTRRKTGLSHEKLDEHVIDFNNPESWQDLVKGDVLFSALGTTIKTAGSQEAQYLVDYTYQYNFAKAAAKNGVSSIVLVSSAQASPNSRIFYSRMKGELEREIKRLTFSQIHILQPGPLEGERPENRTGEKIGVFLLHMINSLGLFRRYRPIGGDIVAQAMRAVCLTVTDKTEVYVLDKLFGLANQ